MSKLKPASDKDTPTVKHVQDHCSPADVALEEAMAGARRVIAATKRRTVTTAAALAARR